MLLTIALKSWQPLAVASAKNEKGEYEFSKYMMVILVEFSKFVFSIICFYLQTSEVWKAQKTAQAKKRVQMSWIHHGFFLFSSILYAFSNIIVFTSMQYINPALYHVFGNLRILITGILYRIILGRTLNDVQWCSLILLTIGAVMATPDINSPDLFRSASFFGLTCVIAQSVSSTLASVVLEKAYKSYPEMSIFYQNAVIYIYGMVVNVFVMIVTEDFSNASIFKGFSLRTSQPLLCMTAMGISLSFVFKFLDNIAYVFSLTISMIITTMLSMIFFDFHIQTTFICAVLTVITAIYLYYRDMIIEKYKAIKDKKEKWHRV